ncbi:hypothetical protein PACTADRAFT_31383 [Pachysolen tannophilus NRRL Y-2460]|uniref:ATP synthase subunit g, mitochondrial n=1 Tax=Pachysolen tannophilus NRRL Y-2460 TaxID=669874 RepID=A0A1E4U244_PACTA|nr:hypothetical protein PACTADRAFT_31383 [Pachysolen tannophilus NRRL Y-2460]
MFSRSFINSSRLFARGVRFNSTSSRVSGITEKLNGLKDSTLYWSKVIAELSKQVYLKEGLSPPNTTQLQSVYKSLYESSLKLVENPKALLEYLKTVPDKITKNTVIEYSSYAIQLAGLFSLGEVVGRRKLIGYHSYGPKEEHHH